MGYRSDFCVAREPRWLVRLVRWNNKAKAVTGPTGWRNGIDGTRRSQARMRLTWDRGNFHGVAGGGVGRNDDVDWGVTAQGAQAATAGQGRLAEGSGRVWAANPNPMCYRVLSRVLDLAFCSG